jgi:hypothetical protein
VSLAVLPVQKSQRRLQRFDGDSCGSWSRYRSHIQAQQSLFHWWAAVEKQLSATRIDPGNFGADERHSCSIAEMAQVDFDLVSAIKTGD